ncbi:MAG: glycosyltransferase [Candidatus Zambryskibacteria bacterium]|nr:glycosyltransferase [Candidatus Zambryskibacteria bacterium]
MQDKKAKRVVHLITKGSPYGGAQNYVFTLATNLPKAEFESIVLMGGDGELKERLEASGIWTETIPYLGRDINPVSEIRAFFALIKKLKKLKPDVLHTNSSKAGLLGALAGRIARVPRIIFTGHAWASNEDRPWIIRKFFLLLHWKTILLSDRTICVSKKTKNDMAGLSLVGDKTCVIYNGISPFELYTKEDARTKIRSTIGLHEDPGTHWIGTISELHTNKGLDLAIHALSHIATPFIFLIIGGGEKKLELESLIRTLNLETKIYLLGNIPDAKKYLKAFDIFTLTSRTEALPYTLLEAGLSELPVLATRVGGISEIIDNGVNGVLVRPRSDSMQQGLEHLLSQQQKRTEYGLKLKQKIEKNFSLQQQIAQTIHVYNGDF